MATRRTGSAPCSTGVGTDVGLHLHETRDSALERLDAHSERGVDRFDTVVGGLGGSPFAPAAGGNLATEDLVHALADSDHDTGVDLDALLAIGPQLRELVGHGLPSRVCFRASAASDPLTHSDRERWDG